MQAKLDNVKQYWRLLSGNYKPITPRVTKEAFFQHFLSLSNPSGDFYTADEDVIEEYRNIIEADMQEVFEELNIPIDQAEVARAIKELKLGKSGAEDLLINEFFIYGQAQLTTYLTPLFNYVFNSGIFPSTWSDGLLIPLHKKGSQSNPENFRGITLLGVLGKLFTRIINSRLNVWAERYGIYVEAQYGFRKGRSTTDCIFILHNVINSFIQSGKRLYAFFVDYSKAFDYVVRDNLWYKMIKCGVRGKVLNIIQSMYSHVKTKVYCNGEKSETFECHLGVRQGECLSPFLFAMYVNDLEFKLSSTSAGISVDDMKILLLFYADDVVIFGDTPDGLQSGIDSLFEYCNKWKLKLNTIKSQVIVFKKGNSRIQHTWYFGDTELKVSNKIPYLGIMFSSNGSFNVAQTVLAEQADKAVFMLYKRLNTFTNLKPDFMLDMFDKFISPILNYGCEVWGFHEAHNIERVHLKFCKNVLGVKRSTQNDFIYGELERVPMKIIRYYRIVKYWLNIVHGKKSHYVNGLYHASLKQLDQNDKPSWARSVRMLIFNTGFGEVWYNQGVGKTGA